MAISPQRFKFADSDNYATVIDMISSTVSNVINDIAGSVLNSNDSTWTQLIGLNPSNLMNGGDITSLLTSVGGQMGLGSVGTNIDYFGYNSWSEFLMANFSQTTDKAVDWSQTEGTGISNETISGVSGTMGGTGSMTDAEVDAYFHQVMNTPDVDNDTKVALSDLPKELRKSMASVAEYSRNAVTLVTADGVTNETLKSGADVDSIAKALNSLTGGVYKPTIQDQNARRNLIAGLANAAFDSKLPKAFSKIISKVTLGNDGIVAGDIVIRKALLRGDMDAVIDVANSPVGKDIKAYNPYIAQEIIARFNFPTGLRQENMATWSDEFIQCMYILDPVWLTYMAPESDNTILSVASLKDATTSILSLFRAAASNEAMEIDLWDTPVYEEVEFIYAALQGPREPTLDSILKFFPSVQIYDQLTPRVIGFVTNQST